VSGITSISGFNSSAFQWLAQLAAQGGAQQAAGTSVASELPTIGSASNAETTGTDVGSLTALQEAIRSAVLSALQDAEKSGDTTDLMKVIHQAVEQALKDNGIAPDTLKGQTGNVGQSDSTDSTSSSQQQPDQQIDPNVLVLLAQLLTSLNTTQGSNDLLTQLSTSQDNAGTTSVAASNNLQDQIRSAVSAAIQKVEQSGNTADLKTAIHDAVDQVLKDNGIDPEKLKEQLAAEHAAHKGHHHRHHGQTGGAGQTTAASTTAAGNTTDEASSTSNSSQQPGQQVDPNITDLLALLLTSSNGNQNVTGFLFDLKQ